MAVSRRVFRLLGKFLVHKHTSRNLPCVKAILAMTVQGHDARALEFVRFEAKNSIPSARKVTEKLLGLKNRGPFALNLRKLCKNVALFSGKWSCRRLFSYTFRLRTLKKEFLFPISSLQIVSIGLRCRCRLSA